MAAVFKGGLGEVVHAVVVAVHAQLGGQDWGVLEGFIEKGARERSALGHHAEGYKFCLLGEGVAKFGRRKSDYGWPNWNSAARCRRRNMGKKKGRRLTT